MADDKPGELGAQNGVPPNSSLTVVPERRQTLRRLPHLGVDTIGLTFPIGDVYLGVDDEPLPGTPWHEGPVHGPYKRANSSSFPDLRRSWALGRQYPGSWLSRTVLLAGQRIDISVRDNGEYGWWANVEFEVSRVRNPLGYDLCPLDEVHIWAQAVLIWLGKLSLLSPQCRHTEDAGHSACCVDPSCFMLGVRVARLDLTIDFVSVNDLAVPKALMMAARPTRLHWKREYDTGAVAKGALYVKTYDLHARRPGVTSGTARVEVEARKGPLSRRGLRKLVEPINRVEAERLFLEGFKWAGLDVRYGGYRPTSERLAALHGSSRRIAAAFHELVRAGQAAQWPRARAVRALAHLRSLGIVAGLPESQQVRPRSRLDPITAQELHRDYAAALRATRARVLAERSLSDRPVA